MASASLLQALITLSKSGKCSDGGPEAGEGSENFPPDAGLALRNLSSWLASLLVRKNRWAIDLSYERESTGTLAQGSFTFWPKGEPFFEG